MWKKLFPGKSKRKDSPCSCAKCSPKDNGTGVKFAQDLKDDFNWDSGEDEDTPPLPCDIIRRNKRAIKVMSQRQRELKRTGESGQFLRMWSTTCGPKIVIKANKKKKKPFKPSLIDAMKKEKDCNCEIMARAVGGGNVHKHIGLIERRDEINAGSPNEHDNLESKPDLGS